MPETIKCVHCAAPLRLPEEYFGQEVRCPSCQRAFTARLPAEPPPRRPLPEPAPEPRETPSVAHRRPREIDDDDAPSGRRRPRIDDDEDYPRKRAPRYQDDRGRRSYMLADRGGMIMALGVASLVISLVFAPLVCFCFPTAIVSLGLGLTATFLGRSDLAEIKSGQRDPTGQSMTNGGMICGIIGAAISCLLLLFGCLFFTIGMLND